jgi:Na+/proline symporter
LFAGASWAQRHRERLKRSPLRVYFYTLALAVYCTSWTYFGAVGSAVADGWTYLPIFLGPILLFALAPGFLERLVSAVHADGATSISDFIGSRFGKSRGLAALVTILALFGSIPYLALQLRSVAISYRVMSGGENLIVPILCAAVVLACFAVLFGTRNYEVAARNEPVLYAVGTESAVKLLALVAVAAFAVVTYLGAPADAQQAGLSHLLGNFSPQRFTIDFPIVTLLSMMAIICLPRQFYIGVMEAQKPHDIREARWPFITYLVITAITVIPIAVAGLVVLPKTASPDFFALSLPISMGANILAEFVFLGGLSAATAMAITETIALSTMVSNDLIAPFVLQSRSGDDTNFGQILLWARRGAIALLMAGAASYAMLIPPGAQLASVGLIAFVAMTQSAPALIMAVWRADNDAAAAKAGLVTGFVLWFHTLFLPAVGLSPDALKHTVLDPAALLGFTGLSPIAHGALWSLGGNMLVHALVAGRRVKRPDFAIRISRQRGIARISTVQELAEMVERFAGAGASAEIFGGNAPPAEGGNRPVDRKSAHAAERAIASVVGASSARAIMASALSGANIGLGEVALMLDASGQSLHFSQKLLAATLEHIDPGVSVVDRDLRLVAWNSRYLELFAYPPGMVRLGAPIADLIRFNAERGECGLGEVESHVARRLDHMRKGHAHSFERLRPDGRIVKTVGGPMPNGGYVMCFTDITQEAQGRAALEMARAELEQRVETRTAELSQANERLAAAMADKTRFLAAASHDLLQPLHAARLFTASLRRSVPETAIQTLNRVDRSRRRIICSAPCSTFRSWTPAASCPCLARSRCARC